MQTEDNIVEEYGRTLRDLRNPNKAAINALTMLADEHKDSAVRIASCIEDRLKTAPVGLKLSLMYLIDSVCKNISQSIYVQLFTQNIVSNFCHVYEVSDANVRKSLQKLKLTWDEAKTFPESKLNAINDRARKIDPRWPIQSKQITPASEPSRVANQPPRRTNNQPQLTSNNLTNNGPETSAGFKRPASQNNRRKRLKSARQMGDDQVPMMATPQLHIQQISQPMNPAVQSIAQLTQPMLQPPPLSQAHHQPFIVPNVIPAPCEYVPSVHAPFLDPNITMSPNDQLHNLASTTFLNAGLMMPSINDSQMMTSASIACAPSNQPQSKPVQEPQIVANPVLETLYGGQQCSNCSLRFDIPEDYKEHLDWHFRQNQKIEKPNTQRREWYYPMHLWVLGDEELSDQFKIHVAEQERAPDVDFEPETTIEQTANTVRQKPGANKDTCPVCKEEFEVFYDDEEDEWRLRNAILHEDDNVYHPSCLKDVLHGEMATRSLSVH